MPIRWFTIFNLMPSLDPPAPACTSLLKRIELHERSGFTSTHVVSEVVHRLMTLEACAIFGWPFAGIAQRLRRHPAEVRQLTRFRQAIQEVSQHGLTVLPIPVPHLDTGAWISQQTGLLTNDAWIVAVMQQHALTNLASHEPTSTACPGSRATPRCDYSPFAPLCIQVASSTRKPLSVRARRPSARALLGR